MHAKKNPPALAASNSGKVLAGITANIRKGLDDRRANMFSLGAELFKAEAVIEHGGWLKYLEDEFELSDQTARNWMRAAKLAAKFKTVLNLNLSIRVIHELAKLDEEGDRDGTIKAALAFAKSDRLTLSKLDEIANEFHRAAAAKPEAEITETIKGTSHDSGAETDALSKLPEAEQQSLAEAVTAHNARETGAVHEVIPDGEQPQADDRDVAAAEAYARWLPQYEAVKAKQAGLVQELDELYRPFEVKMVDLLLRIEEADREVRRVNDAKPLTSYGDGRLLGNTESVARASGLSTMKYLKLPGWEGNSPQWLLPLQIAASMGSRSAAEELDRAHRRALNQAAGLGG